MNNSVTANEVTPATYRVVGFDRLRFVDDVTNAIPQDDTCRIVGLSFLADGVRVDGRLTVNIPDEGHRMKLDRQLRAIRGIVSVTQIN
ncbi:ACT domain-containing protein [Spirosoma montaniterrae]|uniref:ACT domain-containing protein n=1 Tax=Spirosoma montaniterrae TaxID=1178516 RepID=A0A1P9WTS1_9BACT|nr:ACT domain-containing protein [Spirosoma montaniterrae]AQG78772.1 hypothetical protein AWR27_05185 [Spirosoma montaniterrae]